MAELFTQSAWTGPLPEVGRNEPAWRVVADFFCEGDPKGQPRPRAFARKMGGKFVARVYDAGTAEGWKSCIAAAAREQIPREPYRQAIMLMIRVQMPRPKSHYRTGRHAGELKPDAPRWHTGKPDFDNLEKAIADALTTLGMWADDGQVVKCDIEKKYGPRPGARVMVMVEQ